MKPLLFALRTRSKIIFLSLISFIVIIWCSWHYGLVGIAPAVAYVAAISVQILQHTVVLASTLLLYASRYKDDSLLGLQIAQTGQQQIEVVHDQVRPADVGAKPQENIIAVIETIDAARQMVDLEQRLEATEPVIPTLGYTLPLAHIGEHIETIHCRPGVNESLQRLIKQQPQISTTAANNITKIASASEISQAIERVLGSNSSRAIARHIEQRMALQSRLGLMNFHGVVLSAGESANGHITYYVGLKEKRSSELHANIQTARWLARRQVEELLANDHEYRSYVYQHYCSSINTMLATNDENPIKRIRARLMLPALIFEGNNYEEFYKTAHKIQTHFFTRDGALCPVGRTNVVQPLMKDLLGTVRKSWPEIYSGIDVDKLHPISERHAEDVWALWFAPDATEFSERCIKNPENKLVLKALDACEQGDLKLAQSLYDQTVKLHMSHAPILIQDIIKETRNLLFDEWGVYKIAQRDPLYKRINSYEKEYLHKNQLGLEKLNETLLLRHHLVAKCKQAWSIPDTAAPAVHDALYAMLDDNALALTNVPLLIDKAMSLTSDYQQPQHKQLLDALFLPNGVFKDFAHYPRAKLLNIPSEIFKVEHIMMRRMLNNALYIEHTMPNTEHARAAAGIIQAIEYRFTVSDAQQKSCDRFIHRAYKDLTQQMPSKALVVLQEIFGGGDQAAQNQGCVHMPMPDPNDPEHIKTIHKYLRLLEQSKELKELNKITAELEKKLDDTKVRTKNPNSISAHEFFRLEEKAKIIYDQHRAMTTDVDKIAANTGVPRAMIQRIKNHVFYEDHILHDGERFVIKKFDPNIDMAEAWQRLVDGSFKKADLMMLKHEYAESLIMEGIQVSYKEAHHFINSIYNWEKLLIW
ncbi:hypothetical protein KJZ61_01660 [Candidatus Dependentiae bacterium]|nr:hypothetical protein [Candidatus Dependentiae bacterium]